jgi:hypothetical protein
MNIKNNKPKKNSGYSQGYFPINECQKYIGPGPIIYRSSWERKFCMYCESNPQIVKWSSEPVKIKYINSLDGREHSYFPDYYMKLESGEEYLIEVKPSSQLQKPNPPKRKTKKSVANYKYAYEMYITNMCKIQFAEHWCNKRGWKFLLVTETFFNKK